MNYNTFKKVLVLSSFVVLFFAGCGKNKKENAFYDHVEYYHSDYYKMPTPPAPNESPEQRARYDVYYSDFVDENEKNNYKKLSEFGFVKNEISNEFSDKITDFFTDENPGRKMPDYKCLTCYQDIMLFYKKEKLIGIAKFDFKCNKYYYINFQADQDIYIKKNCLQYRYLFKADNF
ncbi:hypothetical protein [Flavobacterium gelatinilyticum]|uniref:hypothetical protein n=1 Tax=Flavobacterium gelatinilyticum TaxID=3003260 RepID=UPI0024817BAF|nr:hypothetical protein [Flavobacterium gelatinilyticum]